jgi:hypothetical protein
MRPSPASAGQAPDRSAVEELVLLRAHVVNDLGPFYLDKPQAKPDR